MSENIPSTSNCASNQKKSRRKYDKTKLPTPPPDPCEKTDDKDDFLTYLDSLQKSNHLVYSRSTSTFAPVVATEDAFDHLEKLYKLMEQMLELREQNAKLHRRVRDLEHLNNLEKMHRELDVREECPELDKDTAFAETILESILAETKTPKPKPSASSRLRQSISRKHRNRSGSVSISTEKPLLEPETMAERRASACVGSIINKKPAKVSKWTKVKAAFKWEKASACDAKSQDSGIAGMVPVNMEVARYLRVPSTSDDHGHSPVDSGAAEISTPGTLSTASSAEDFHRNDFKSPCEYCSDEEHGHCIQHSKDVSQKSKCHKTPWARMKDIIQTRNSFKKKHRLSGHSDDIQIELELCSDNEEVFEDDDKNKTVKTSEIPPEVVARYQQAIAEDGSFSENNDPKKISKWTRVKKAFLPPHEPTQNPTIPTLQTDDEKINTTIQDEIQQNYKQLQKKLSLEFQEKFSEWERTKQNSPSIPNPSSSCGFVEEGKDFQKIKPQPSIKTRSNIHMTSEENLPPEFRKKLQEWEKIRKFSGKECSSKKKLSEVPRWKSLSGPRTENSPIFEYPQISEDFKKKLEEWKQIKAGNQASPKPTRKDISPKQNKKSKEMHDKELQWFEKELGKIEKEKQRLERERQKFLEREESLAKLRSSVVGGLKKEVLIHTPSGFYRFEGISRKFTQKLYEWEKAQGIGPESSTFALLSSSLIQNSKPYLKLKGSDNTPSLVRSKSADSIAISALNLSCPLMSHQPSSLSLNDVDELEQECLADSKSSSIYAMNSHESLPLDEPEALIVEIEDIVEETAAPLHTYAQKIQQPVYQREEFKTMCEGETCAAPKIRRSESARAQNNYNLIEEIFNILKSLIENELEIQKTQDLMVEQEKKSNSDIIKLKMFDESQKAIANRLNDKVIRLQEANSQVFSNIAKEEEPEVNVKNIMEILETVQDLSSEICQMAEKLDFEMANRNIYDIFREAGARALNPIIETVREIRTKMLEVRRRLSYICAASDLTAPRCRHSTIKKTFVKKTISNETDKSQNDTDFCEKSTEKKGLYVKSESSNTQNQGAIKKRIRCRQKSLQSRTLLDTDEEEDNLDKKRNTHKKLAKTKSVSECCTINAGEKNEIVVDESIIQKVVVPTKTNFLNLSPLENQIKSPDSPVTLFVKTTRKLFTPLVESGLSENSSYPEANILEDTTCAKIINPIEQLEENKSESSFVLTDPTPIAHLPPLPASPVMQKKITKDISPSIRIMLAKYNQKISEQESQGPKSGGSSGSPSPLPWRSPSAERRVKQQTEKYQEELNKLSPREVRKCASVGFLHKQNLEEKKDSVLKSSSSSALVKKEVESVSVNVNSKHSSEIRLQKLQKAKEEFLKSPSTPQVREEPIKFPTRNRLSQISVDSESSYESACTGTLIKSASAGMINIDADVYRQLNSEVHGGGYVSLPRCTKKQKQGLLGGKFTFSNIASKFRKVKMRRGKDKDANKMNTVSTLCRQSLLVDINPNENQSNESNNEAKPSCSDDFKSGSWIRKAKLFKK